MEHAWSQQLHVLRLIIFFVVVVDDEDDDFWLVGWLLGLISFSDNSLVYDVKIHYELCYCCYNLLLLLPSLSIFDLHLLVVVFSIVYLSSSGLSMAYYPSLSLFLSLFLSCFHSSSVTLCCSTTFDSLLVE